MLTLAMPLDAKPACNTPEGRKLVDAAFERQGGPESHQLRRRWCPGCPVRLECLLLGNANGEHGVWGGLNGHERANAGGKAAWSKGTPNNLRSIDHGRDRRTDRAS